MERWNGIRQQWGLPWWLSWLRHSAHRPGWSAGGAGVQSPGRPVDFMSHVLAPLFLFVWYILHVFHCTWCVLSSWLLINGYMMTRLHEILVGCSYRTRMRSNHNWHTALSVLGPTCCRPIPCLILQPGPSWWKPHAASDISDYRRLPPLDLCNQWQHLLAITYLVYPGLHVRRSSLTASAHCHRPRTTTVHPCTYWPPLRRRRCRLHATGCSATSLGLRLLLSIKFIITRRVAHFCHSHDIENALCESIAGYPAIIVRYYRIRSTP